MSMQMHENLTGMPKFRPLARIAARFAGYRVYRDKMAELELVSDRELDELNITRNDLREIALQAARRREAELLAA